MVSNFRPRRQVPRLKLLPNASGCFVCGRDNAAGLKLRFQADAGGVCVQFMPDLRHQGFGGVLHGGIVAAVLDDALWYAIYSATGKATMTAELTLRYKKSVPCDAMLTVRGELVADKRRLFAARGGIYSLLGELLAEASGTFLPAPPELASRLAAELAGAAPG